MAKKTDWTELDAVMIELRIQKKTIQECADRLGVGYVAAWRRAKFLGYSRHVRFGPKTNEDQESHHAR